MEPPEIAPILRELRIRSGLSFQGLADAMEAKGKSSIQHMFADGYRAGRWLEFDVASKFAVAVLGKGDPPITSAEVFALTGIPSVDSRAFELPDGAMPPAQAMPLDVPVFGTAMGAPLAWGLAASNGSVMVETTMLDTTEPIDYLRRPPALARVRGLYGVFVSGTSMEPRYEEADVVLVDPKRPPSNGDFVIVQLVTPDAHDGDRVSAVMIKRLVRRVGDAYELAQFNPPATFTVPRHIVRHIHRIVSTKDTIGI